MPSASPRSVHSTRGRPFLRFVDEEALTAGVRKVVMLARVREIQACTILDPPAAERHAAVAVTGCYEHSLLERDALDAQVDVAGR
jgi:hypothetical protein